MASVKASGTSAASARRSSGRTPCAEPSCTGICLLGVVLDLTACPLMLSNIHKWISQNSNYAQATPILAGHQVPMAKSVSQSATLRSESELLNEVESVSNPRQAVTMPQRVLNCVERWCHCTPIHAQPMFSRLGTLAHTCGADPSGGFAPAASHRVSISGLMAPSPPRETATARPCVLLPSVCQLYAAFSDTYALGSGLHDRPAYQCAAALDGNATGVAPPKPARACLVFPCLCTCFPNGRCARTACVARRNMDLRAPESRLSCWTVSAAALEPPAREHAVAVLRKRPAEKPSDQWADHLLGEL